MGLYWLKAGPCVSVLDCTYCQGLKHKSSMIKQLAWIALIIYQCKPPSEPRCHPSISWAEIFISWWLMEDAGFLWPGQLRMRHGQIWGWLQTWDIYNAICVCVCLTGRGVHKSVQSLWDKSSPLCNGFTLVEHPHQTLVVKFLGYSNVM